MTFTDDALTDDGFLGGRLRVLQPRRGYRAAADPVFLAAAVDARPGQSVLELGCGAGVAVLCLAARVPDLVLHGAELQQEYADLARRNARRNGLALQVHEATIARLPPTLRALGFDHVMMNPPYYAQAGGTPAADPGRELALREALPLAGWLTAGLRRLLPGGQLWVIQDAARLVDLLAACAPLALGDLRILPVAPRRGKAASRIILRGRKGARGPVRLLPPLVVHAGDSHLADADDHGDLATAILRHGAPLSLAE